MRIRTGDMVVVTTGDDRSSVAKKVLSVDRAAGKVVVEGVNRAYRHMKRGAKSGQSGRVSIENPIQVSNVAIYCPHCARGVRVGIVRGEGVGPKRICCRCKKDC